MKRAKFACLLLAGFIGVTGGGLASQSQAAAGKACVNFFYGCFPMDCQRMGTTSTCTEDDVQKTYNHITQPGFYLGHCQDGSGTCAEEEYTCHSYKYYDTGSTEPCTEAKLRCHDEGKVEGCKNS